MPKIRLENVRLAFPDLFQAKAIGTGKPSFGARFIIDPSDKKTVAMIEKAMAQAAADQPKWKGKHEQILAKLIKDKDVCLLKEDYCDKNGDPYAGFEDMYSLGTRSQTQPLLIDEKKRPLEEIDGKPYGGCYVNASVEIWAQDNSFGRRINAHVKGVQFVRDGEAFSGGAPASADEFEDLSDGVDDDELENDLA